MTISLLLALIALSHLLAIRWGPGHHLEFAERVWRRRREMLPRTVARLLAEEKRAYFYGNLAADIINAKAYGGHLNHCHRWTIIDHMRELAAEPREEAFILGYLSHLAADTIAHNHYVPYHLTRYARARGLGHLYWELNADRFVPVKRWDIVAQLKDDPGLDALDDLINRAVPRKALSMGTNKIIFNHVLLVSERKQWRGAVERIHPMRRVALTKGFLSLFQKAAVARIRLALHPRGVGKLHHIDTTGKRAQKEALGLRREIVASYRPGPERDRASVELAARFLENMSSPPGNSRNASPHWN